MRRIVAIAIALGGCDAPPEVVPDIADDVVVLGAAEVNEAVDIETDGEYAYLCGGFGGRVIDVREPSSPVSIGGIGGRCQRIGIGAALPDGGRVVYIAHHGDSRWATPYLMTYHRTSDGGIELIDQIDDAEVLFEGLAFHDGVLYVAAHAGGVRVYTTDEAGVPSYYASVDDGVDNAWKLAIDAGHLYVADHAGALHVLSVADPLAPELVASVPTSGRPRDVDVRGDRAYVALGSTGVDVFDVADPASPSLVGTIATGASVQAVAIGESTLALANWTHVAIADPVSLEVVATERPVGPLEQDMGVAMLGDLVLAAEWGNGLFVLEHRPGNTAPDLWFDEPVHTFRGDGVEARAVIVRNRGAVTLDIDAVEVTDAASYSVDAESLRIEPGGADVIELTYTPGQSDETRADLILRSNDPDAEASTVPLYVGDDSVVQVGDQLGAQFGFLDPNGAGDVVGLDGNVALLVYFGLW